MKKIMKASLALALAFGGVSAVSGCFKDDDTTQTEKSEQEKIYDLYVSYMNAQGKTPASYEDWLKSVKGTDGTNGKDGKNGSTWHKGEGVPANLANAVVGDYYLDTLNQDIYFLGANGWEKTIDLDEDNSKQLAPGKYVFSQEEGESVLTATIEIGRNGEIISSNISQSVVIEEGGEYFEYAPEGLIPTSVDTTLKTITLELYSSENDTAYEELVKPNLVDGEIYTLKVADGVEIGQFGQLMVDGSVTYADEELIFSETEFSISAEINPVYEIIEKNIFKFSLEGEEGFAVFEIGEEVEYKGESYTSLIKRDDYLAEEDWSLLYGTFTKNDPMEGISEILVRKNKVVFFVNGQGYIADYEIEEVIDEDEVMIKLTDKHANGSITLNLSDRTYQGYYEFVLTGKYHAYGEGEDITVVQKDDQVFINGEKEAYDIYHNYAYTYYVLDKANNRAYRFDIEYEHYYEVKVEEYFLLGKVLVDNSYYNQFRINEDDELAWFNGTHTLYGQDQYSNSYHVTLSLVDSGQSRTLEAELYNYNNDFLTSIALHPGILKYVYPFSPTNNLEIDFILENGVVTGVEFTEVYIEE